MYAVIKTGGHQYRVQEGDSITIEQLEGKEGDKLTFDQVLMVGGTKLMVGAPLLAGAKVLATIKSQTKNPKVTIFKYKRRKHYKRWRGHRQPVTIVEIGKISV